MRRPRITLKIAQTFDGKIAATGGKSRWITGPESRAFVHRLRARHDGILIGKNTLLQDNPRLNSNRRGRPFWKIILTSPSLLPFRQKRIFQGDCTVVFVAEPKDLKKWRNDPSLKKRKTVFVAIKKNSGGYDLKKLMTALSRMGVKKLMVEGGGEVFWAFLKSRLADKIYWMMAPKVLGGRDAKTSMEGEGVKNPNRAVKLKISRQHKLGRDFCFEGRLD